MKPFTQVVNGEQFLTYAEDLDMARLAFTDEGLPGDGRIREQRLRKASEFKYTHPDRGNTSATVVGDVPPEFADKKFGTYDPKLVEITIGAAPETDEVPS